MQIFLLLFTSTFLLLSIYFPSTYPLLLKTYLLTQRFFALIATLALWRGAGGEALSRKKSPRNCQAIGNSASFAQINSLENFLATHRLLNSYP